MGLWERKRLHAGATRAFTWGTGLPSWVADTLFIRITVTFRSNAGTFLFLFCKQVNSKVVPSLYLGHTVVLLQHLWQIYHFFPINLVFSIFSSWHPFCFMVTQKYNLSQLGSPFPSCRYFSHCQVPSIHLSWRLSASSPFPLPTSGADHYGLGPKLLNL